MAAASDLAECRLTKEAEAMDNHLTGVTMVAATDEITVQGILVATFRGEEADLTILTAISKDVEEGRTTAVAIKVEIKTEKSLRWSHLQQYRCKCHGPNQPSPPSIATITKQMALTTKGARRKTWSKFQHVNKETPCYK